MLVAGVALAATVAAAEEVKKYPPYPEVWGRELPAPEDVNVYTRAYPGEDGEMLFGFSYWKTLSPGNGSQERQWDAFFFKFFEGTLQPLADKEANDIFRSLRGEELNKRRLVFEDGGTVEWKALRYGGPKCGVLFNSHIVRKDKEGNVLQDKMLFHLYEKPVQWRVNRYCEISGGRDHIDLQFESILSTFTLLADETFLAYGLEGRFVIRFDREMRSPYVEARPNLFLVDTSAIEAIIEEADRRPGSALQNESDAALAYLLEVKEKKK